MASRCECGARIQLVPDGPQPSKCRDCMRREVLQNHGVDPENPTRDGVDRLLE